MVFCMEKALVDNALWRGPRYGRRRQRSSVSEGLPYQTVRRLNRQDDGTLLLAFTPVHDDSTKKPFSRKEHADGDIGKTPVPEYPCLSGKKNGSERSCTVENEESAPDLSNASAPPNGFGRQHSIFHPGETFDHGHSIGEKRCAEGPEKKGIDKDWI